MLILLAWIVYIYIYIYILEMSPASREVISSMSRVGVLGVTGGIVCLVSSLLVYLL